MKKLLLKSFIIILILAVGSFFFIYMQKNEETKAIVNGTYQYVNEIKNGDTTTFYGLLFTKNGYEGSVLDVGKPLGKGGYVVQITERNGVKKTKVLRTLNSHKMVRLKTIVENKMVVCELGTLNKEKGIISYRFKNGNIGTYDVNRHIYRYYNNNLEMIYSLSEQLVYTKCENVNGKRKVETW